MYDLVGGSEPRKRFGDLSSGGLGLNIAKELSLKRQLFFGGNARARTADLLRVKQAL